MTKNLSQLLFFLFMVPCISAQQQETLSLNTGWEFSQMNKNQWYHAEVPGSVQRDLVRHKILPNPFWAANEEKIQWVEDENWDFRKSFIVTAQQLKYDESVLFFEGLDTHADVFLNGSRILRSENMFIGYKVPVKHLLKEGENHLYIRFHSPIQTMLPARTTFGYDYPAGNDHRKEKVSIYNRKAPYHFGWDWGIRIVQMGIWKGVSLKFQNKAHIDDFFVKQTSVTKELAVIDNEIDIFSHVRKPIQSVITIQYGLKGENTHVISKDIVLQPGNNNIVIPLKITHPKRWMPVHWGEQHLYDFQITLSIGKELVDQKKIRTGLRSVRLVQEKDQHGSSFYFEVNGIPLFAKGANYIPGEIFSTQQDEAYYDRLFDNISAANINFIRVWGGGIYESDAFYRRADEKGILIWQDFIFGCTPYPSDQAFLNNVRQEAIYNIKRLRNHPSLAFWCGNNEVEEALRYWGFEKNYPPEVMDAWYEGYNKTFRELIPNLLKKLDSTRSYIHGSPYDSNWGKPDKFASSDAHDWGLWHGRMPFEALRDRLPRFASEFGFQSFPEMKTIRSFAEEKDFDISSEVMNSHQKSSTGNEAIKEYMDMYFHTPKNFEDFIYVGLVMQGNGMEESVEAMRRGRPYCMGALYWQMNDDWPAVSWSSIDYYNNWKAQHYRMRDVFAPLALGVEYKGEKLNYYTMSDYLHDYNNLLLTVQVIDFSTGKKKEFTERVDAKANESRIVKTFNVSDLVSESEKTHTVIHAFLKDDKGQVISSKDHFFYWPIKLDLPETEVTAEVQYGDGECTVTLFSSKLAKDVFVEIPIHGARFSDNFIDLLPEEKRTITITSPELRADYKTPITVTHVRKCY